MTTPEDEWYIVTEHSESTKDLQTAKEFLQGLKPLHERLLQHDIQLGLGHKVE